MCRVSQSWRDSPIGLPILIYSLTSLVSISLALPPTTAPLFKDTPFAAIWNAPTNVCDTNGISLDFSAFQAVTTPASTPNQFLFLFYKDRLGLYPYIDTSTRKQYNGGIPQKGNLAASLKKSISDIKQSIPESITGLSVIDWESWDPLWERNWDSLEINQKFSIQYAKEKTPSLSSAKAVTVAKQQFQEAARAYMEQTIQQGIKMRPKYLWGYYLFPNCHNYGWDKPGYTGECSESAKRLNNELLWLWESSTALYPSAYLSVGQRKNPSTALFVRGQVEEAVRVSILPRQNYTVPIYVYLRPVFHDQNNAYLDEADLVSTIGESAALGASGTVLWGASADFHNKASCEALAAYLPSTLGPYIANVTAAAKLCSTTLCQRNGRCVRKNPSSNVYLHLNPNNFKIQKRNGKYVAIGVPSSIDLNIFKDGFICQCYVGQECSKSMPSSVSKTQMVIEV
ncbi:hyaluronidase PH-20-like [Brachyhypopomus gauderio]|uniref:hyaluronidase PH-20-like n=1 Tax=Brachyhypopomus gauderio TaxID=698409 RepID=UPI004042CCBA